MSLNKRSNLRKNRADVDDWAGSDGDGEVEASGGAAAGIWEETRSEGYGGSSEGFWGEFTARSDGSFEATRPGEAEGNGDVWGEALLETSRKTSTQPTSAR